MGSKRYKKLLRVLASVLITLSFSVGTVSAKASLAFEQERVSTIKAVDGCELIGVIHAPVEVCNTGGTKRNAYTAKKFFTHNFTVLSTFKKSYGPARFYDHSLVLFQSTPIYISFRSILI